MSKEGTQINDLKDKKIDALHPRNDIDRLYVSKEKERGLASMEDHVNESRQRLEKYIKKSKERQIRAPSNSI